MKIFFTGVIGLLFLLSGSVVAQTAEVSAAATKLQQTVTTVQSGSKTYTPKIEFVAPAVIKYYSEEADQKGNKVNFVYEFNLSDLDQYAIREQTQKDLIQVVLAVKAKQKLVKVTKNDEVQPYEEEVKIFSKDIENARAISDIVKKAIVPAEKAMASRMKLSGYDAMVNWLVANVKTVPLGVKSYTQTLAKGDKPGVVKFTQTEVDAKTSTEEIYTFNLADINVNSIKFKISGNKFGIEFETLQEAKYISLRKSGEVKPYVNDIVINTNNVDEARDLKTVLEMAIPLAVEKVKADLTPIASEKDGLERIKKYTTGIESGVKQISQAIDATCLATFTQTEKDPKKAETVVYKFNWLDINNLASKIDVSGDRMFVELVVNEDKKLIMQTLNEKFNGYEKEVKLYMPDVESARRVKFAVDKVTEKCKASYKEPFAADINSTSTWMRKNVKEVTLDETTLKQTLEPVEAGKNDKLKYTRQELNAKGNGGEEVYEFNLADINPLSIEIVVKGKWMYVSMETNFKGKIIKYYKDGKIQPYTSTVEFAINDVDTSRNMVSALKKAIKVIKPN
jgi:hypothetical protein